MHSVSPGFSFSPGRTRRSSFCRSGRAILLLVGQVAVVAGHVPCRRAISASSRRCSSRALATICSVTGTLRLATRQRRRLAVVTGEVGIVVEDELLRS